MKNKSHKTMTLKAAYGQASPVPLKADESISTDRSREVRHYISTGGETTFPKARSIAKITGGAYCQPKGDMAKFYKPEVVATNRVNAALLAHAFSVLPEVVAALQWAESMLAGKLETDNAIGRALKNSLTLKIP